MNDILNLIKGEGSSPVISILLFTAIATPVIFLLNYIQRKFGNKKTILSRDKDSDGNWND